MKRIKSKGEGGGGGNQRSHKTRESWLKEKRRKRWRVGRRLLM